MEEECGDNWHKRENERPTDASVDMQIDTDSCITLALCVVALLAVLQMSC